MTISFRKTRKGRDTSPLFLLTRYNTHVPWTTTSTIQINGGHHHFSSGYQSCNWPRSSQFCWQNPWSGCNSGIDLVVALKYTFFQLCSNTKKIFVKLARFKRNYANHRAAVLVNSTSYTVSLLDVCSAVQSGHVPFFAAVCPQWQ